MPNRIIKESICTSDTLDELSCFTEVVFYRLIVNCDDYGRFDGRPAVLKSRLFPLKSNVTLRSMAAAVQRLAEVGLVVQYEVNGRPYLQLRTWDKHQQVRAKRSRYPACEGMCVQMQADDSGCPRNPNQSESEVQSEFESQPQSGGCAAPEAGWGVQTEKLLAALGDFEAMREKLGKPMTDRAKRLLLEKLRRLSQDEAVQIAILEQSILHGWKDVYALNSREEARTKQSSTTSFDIDEIERYVASGVDLRRELK